MARYWVGGTDSWDSTAGTKWATSSGGAGGASVPTLSDDVFFDSNSGSSIVTVTSSADCRDITFTGFTGTFTGTSSVGVRGSVLIANTMTFSYTGILAISGSGSHTFTTDGIQLTCEIDNSNSTGTYTLQDNLNCTKKLSLLQGTFNANNKNITCLRVDLSSVSSRTVTMGSGIWTLTGTGNCWDASNVTNLTLNADTSTIKFTSSSSVSMQFNGGGKTYYNIWHSGGLGTNNAVEMFGSNTFNNIKLNAGTYMDFNGGTTQTVNSLTVIGTSGNMCALRSFNNTVYTISDTSGTNNVYYCDISYSNASGGATFNAINSIDNGNNTGWNFITQSISGGAGLLLKLLNR